MSLKVVPCKNRLVILEHFRTLVDELNFATEQMNGLSNACINRTERAAVRNFVKLKTRQTLHTYAVYKNHRAWHGC